MTGIRESISVGKAADDLRILEKFKSNKMNRKILRGCKDGFDCK